MILNMNKTEIVFRRPSPLRYHISSSILGMEVVDCIKYFGVGAYYGVIILVLNYVFPSCLNFAVRELTHWDSYVVMDSTLISWTLFFFVRWLFYSFPVCALFLSAGRCVRINAFLKRAYRPTVKQLLFSSDTTLCSRMQNSSHCLHILLPSIKNSQYALGSSASTNYVLPQCKYNLFKVLFSNWCLFNDIMP